MYSEPVPACRRDVDRRLRNVWKDVKHKCAKNKRGQKGKRNFFAIISPKEGVRLRCHQHAAGVLPRRGPQTGHGPTSGLPSKPGMSVGEPILPGGPVDSPSRLVRPDQGESVGQDRFPTDGFDTTPSMLGGCDSSAPPSPPMITAGAIPALDLYRNQPVVGGYGTNDLDPNKFTQTKVCIVFHRHKKICRSLFHNSHYRSRLVHNYHPLLSTMPGLP